MMKTKAYFLRQLPNVGRVSRECEGIPHLTGSGCFIGIVLSNRIESNQIKSNPFVLLGRVIRYGCYCAACEMQIALPEDEM